MHAKTLWACDFFNAKVLTRRGFFNYFVLVFINLKTREIFVTNSTLHPDAAWVEQQGRNFLLHADDLNDTPTHLIRDRDTKFTAKFDDIMKSEGVKPLRLPIQSPNLNSRCERVVQTIKQECLHNFLIFGEKHLNYLVREYVRYYNDNRAHSSRYFLPPTCTDPPPENETIVLDEITCHERFGGLIKWYELAAWAFDRPHLHRQRYRCALSMKSSHIVLQIDHRLRMFAVSSGWRFSSVLPLRVEFTSVIVFEPRDPSRSFSTALSVRVDTGKLSNCVSY